MIWQSLLSLGGSRYVIPLFYCMFHSLFNLLHTAIGVKEQHICMHII